jgi:hypothetical protein
VLRAVLALAGTSHRRTNAKILVRDGRTLGASINAAQTPHHEVVHAQAALPLAVCRMHTTKVLQAL